MVPKILQAQVWKHYRKGQEEDWQITREYADAAKGAIQAVALKEDIPVSGDELELTMYDTFVVKEGIRDQGDLFNGKSKGSPGQTGRNQTAGHTSASA